jgi:hypothetical protein
MKRQKAPKEPARKSLLSEKDYQEGLLRAEILGPDGWMDGLANAAMVEKDERELDEDLRRMPTVFKRLDRELRKRKAAARAPRRGRRA